METFEDYQIVQKGKKYYINLSLKKEEEALKINCLEIEGNTEKDYSGTFFHKYLIKSFPKTFATTSLYEIYKILKEEIIENNISLESKTKEQINLIFKFRKEKLIFTLKLEDKSIEYLRTEENDSKLNIHEVELVFVYKTIKAYQKFEDYIEEKLNSLNNDCTIKKGFLINKKYLDFWRKYSDYDILKNKIEFLDYKNSKRIIGDYRKKNKLEKYQPDAHQYLFNDKFSLYKSVKNNECKYALINKDFWTLICSDEGLSEKEGIKYYIEKGKINFIFKEIGKFEIYTNDNIIKNGKKILFKGENNEIIENNIPYNNSFYYEDKIKELQRQLNEEKNKNDKLEKEIKNLNNINFNLNKELSKMKDYKSKIELLEKKLNKQNMIISQDKLKNDQNIQFQY